MNAEEMFLKHLLQIHTAFPNLKIVLEHVTSKVAVDLVWVLNQVDSNDTLVCT
jgi:dihydroorotase